MESKIVPDTEYNKLTGRLPVKWRNLALLARFDRPIGWWLLFWPCAFALALTGALPDSWGLLLLFLIGSIAMRGAGCVYNDIIDRNLDRQVERTRSRPLASGSTSLKAAWGWLLFLCGVGLVVLLTLPRAAQLIALASLALVAAYPFMKRIWWWPQVWLGLVFSWGALVAWLAVNEGDYAIMATLYTGCIFWVIGYDTIYALQDREDDSLVGIKSSALRLGGHARLGVALFYLLAVSFWSAAIWQQTQLFWSLFMLVPAAIQLIWQVATLDTDDGGDALNKFRSNRLTGLLVAAGFLLAI